MENVMEINSGGLMRSLASQGWNFLRLRGDWKSMPDSSSFLAMVLVLVFLGGFAEQISRGHSFLMAVVVTVSWLAILLWSASTGGRINRRLASALGVLSVAIQVGLVLSTWIPVFEWPVAIWSGVAVMHLLTQATQDGAGAWR
jgi:hypothetical protein